MMIRKKVKPISIKNKIFNSIQTPIFVKTGVSCPLFRGGIAKFIIVHLMKFSTKNPRLRKAGKR